MQKPSKKITEVGQSLLNAGLINQQELNSALELQKSNNSLLGKILIGNGTVKAYDFYQSLAQSLDIKFINLIDNPPDSLFLESEDRQKYLDLKVIPWQMENKIMILATSQPSVELEIWAKDKYQNYQIIITSIFDIYWVIDNNFAAENTQESIGQLEEVLPRISAKTLFTQSFIFKAGIAILLFILMMMIFIDELLIPIFICVNIFYILTLMFKAIFFVAGAFAERQKIYHIDNVEDIKDNSLPTYSMLVPIYKEKERTITNLVNAIRAFDYPKSKLDVKLIVEIDDEQTIESVKNLNLESYFHIIKVPVSYPRTKPKACNYALRFVNGQYVTIYDAEDIPEPQQLKKVIKRFRQAESDIVCVQCRLNYYNRSENMLTKLFSIEYSAWFDFMTPGLEFLKIPVPLGGTSNHFQVETLRDLFAWDPYNVTEDADLGIRISQFGGRTTIINSLTLEEASISLKPWIKQRSRWLKGYMQTYLVHMRQPILLYKQMGARAFFGFMFFVGAPALVFFSIPFVAIISITSIFAPDFFPQWFLNIALLNFLCGIILHFIISLCVIYKNKWWDIKFTSFIFPIYWILHSIASFKGLYELVFKPHYWDKTEHGLTKIDINPPGLC